MLLRLHLRDAVVHVRRNMCSQFGLCQRVLRAGQHRPRRLHGASLVSLILASTVSCSMIGTRFVGEP